MTQVIKFPDMRPPRSRATSVSKLPAPAQFRQISPAIITAQARTQPKPVDRRRRLLWFGVAVGLHAALFLAIWLTPPLRIQWSPSPDAWVEVVSVPPKISPAPPGSPASPAPAAPVQPVTARKRPATPPAAPAKSHDRVQAPAEPHHEALEDAHEEQAR